jgi:putative ABC transport system permease protein
MGEDQSAVIHVPFSTFQRAFNAMNEVHWFAFTAHEGTPASEVQADIKRLLAVKHRIHPDDDLAFGGFNVEEMFDMTNNLFKAITGLGWFVGILTLLAGAIGVSNIMLVIIRERTKEIGIRRSVGASPRSITTQIVLESLTLTVIAGYLGLLSGMLILEAVNAAGFESDFFAQPEIDLYVALISLGVLILSGLLAGFFPACRALAINPVDALRAE